MIFAAYYDDHTNEETVAAEDKDNDGTTTTIADPTADVVENVSKRPKHAKTCAAR
jgi:hypothetical protein